MSTLAWLLRRLACMLQAGSLPAAVEMWLVFVEPDDWRNEPDPAQRKKILKAISKRRDLILKWAHAQQQKQVSMQPS